MPFLRSMAQMTTSSQAARVAMRTLSPPLLPDPVVPANRACRRRNDTRHGSASSNGPEVDRLGDRPGGRPGPRDRLGVRVGVEHAQFAPVGLAVAGRVDADRAAVGAERRFDRGYPRGHVGDGLPAGQAEPGPPAPQVHAGGLDLGAGQADRLGDVRPGGERALHSGPGAAAPVRPPRDREDDRADAEDLRQRRGERAEQRGDREPPARREHGRSRVDPFGEPGQADPRAEHDERERGQVGDGEQPRPPVRVRGVEPPARRRGPRPPWWRARSRSGTATPSRARITATGTGSGRCR